MKHDRLVAHKGAAMANDYVYQLTELGRERAKKFAEQCTYFGSAPVPLEAYIDSVKKQTLADQHPTEDDLHRAFEDLLIDKSMLLRLGPAINSGRGLFLYGAPGNGKTSIAERITKAFGDAIWIPRAIGIDGEIMRLFDPGMHEETPLRGQPGPASNNARSTSAGSASAGRRSSSAASSRWISSKSRSTRRPTSAKRRCR